MIKEKRPISPLLLMLTAIVSSILSLTTLVKPRSLEAQQLKEVASCSFESPTLTVSFLNVGQGDATLISCPDGRHQTLIDGGESSERYPKAEELFRQALEKRMGEDKVLELGIITHPDQDHQFNFKYLLHRDPNRIRLGKFFDNGADNPSSLIAEELRKQAEKAKIPYAGLNSTDSPLEICPASSSRPPVLLEVFSPPPAWHSALGCPGNFNNCSLVTRLEYRGVSVLLMADALLQWEHEALKYPQARAFVRGSTVLKVGHHGSSSSSAEFLKLAAARLSVLSTGRPGKGTTGVYNFPEAETVQRLNEYFDQLYPRVEFSEAPLSVCATLNGSCFWKKVSTGPGIWSTAVAGTIDLHITGTTKAPPERLPHRKETDKRSALEKTPEAGARLCIEGELTARKFELTF